MWAMLYARAATPGHTASKGHLRAGHVPLVILVLTPCHLQLFAVMGTTLPAAL